MPEWWVNTSGLFFVLGSIAMLVIIALTAFMIRLVWDLRQAISGLNRRIEVLTDRVDTITSQVQTITTDVGVRTSGIVRMVDDIAGNAMSVVERFSPWLILGAAVFRIAKSKRR